MGVWLGVGEGGSARARDSEGRGSRDGQPPPLQAGGRGDVTTLPAGGGTSVFFPPGLVLSLWHPQEGWVVVRGHQVVW